MRWKIEQSSVNVWHVINIRTGMIIQTVQAFDAALEILSHLNENDSHLY